MSEIIEPIEIAQGTYWVGRRDPNSIFYANPYLRVFKSPGRDKQFSILIDPGSSSDFAIVSTKVGRILGGLHNLDAVFVNHQDPDVSSASSLLLGRHAPHAAFWCSEETWRLVQSYSLPRDRFEDMNRYPAGVPLETGHVLLPVPSPFCHFRGAVMLYDRETRVLFTGDLFGGLTAKGAVGIYADEGDWTGIRTFHQLYMPANQAIVNTIESISRLTPPVEIIAPQHGRVIRGSLVQEFMSRLAKLPVGLDILDDDGDLSVLAAWNSVLDRVVKTARMFLGSQCDAKLADSPQLKDALIFAQGGKISVAEHGRWAIGQVVTELSHGEAPEIANSIKLEAVVAAEDMQLPAPPIMLDEQGAQL